MARFWVDCPKNNLSHNLSPPFPSFSLSVCFKETAAPGRECQSAGNPWGGGAAGKRTGSGKSGVNGCLGFPHFLNFDFKSDFYINKHVFLTFKLLDDNYYLNQF